MSPYQVLMMHSMSETQASMNEQRLRQLVSQHATDDIPGKAYASAMMDEHGDVVGIGFYWDGEEWIDE